MKKCPFCAEVILSEAIKCKHCGEFLHSSEEKSKEEIRSDDEYQKLSRKKLFDKIGEKNILTESLKKRIVLQPGLQVSLDNHGEISAILYRGSWIFSKWALVSESTNKKDLESILDKIHKSYGRGASVDKIGYVQSSYIYDINGRNIDDLRDEVETIIKEHLNIR